MRPGKNGPVVAGSAQIVDAGHMAMKVYMLILLLGAIAAFAHMSTLGTPSKPERLG
jgi:hypothetical protein